MRLLHIADVHLQRPFNSLGFERGRVRRAELATALQGIVDLARARNADALCIAGDLFEREKAGPAVGETLRAMFARLGDIPVVISPGNHDHLGPGCLYDAVSWSPNVHIFRSASLTALPVADGTIWGCAFVGPERHTSPLAGFVAPNDGPQVALVHADVVGPAGPSVYGPLDPAEIGASGVQFAMLGHVHAGRIADSRSYAYPGSLEPLDPSETGPRWAFLVDASHGGVRVEPMTVARRRALTDDLDVTAISTIADLKRSIDERRASWDDAVGSLVPG